MRVGLLAAVSVMILAGGAFAAPPPPVVAALAMLKSGGTELAAHWKYEERISGPRGSERLSYDPSRASGARWKVLAVNGKPPNDSERKFLATQAARAGETTGSGIAVGSGWLAASDYRLVETTAKTLVYQLRPRPAAGDNSGAARLLRHLAGRFVIARDDHRPLSLDLDNFESFSPRFGVRVDAFAFRVRFRRLSKNGPVVAVRTSHSSRGRVFWIKRFEDRTEVTLAGFAPVTASAPGSLSLPRSRTSSAAGRN